jgi:hypothetical protein
MTGRSGIKDMCSNMTRLLLEVGGPGNASDDRKTCAVLLVPDGTRSTEAPTVALGLTSQKTCVDAETAPTIEDALECCEL